MPQASTSTSTDDAPPTVGGRAVDAADKVTDWAIRNVPPGLRAPVITVGQVFQLLFKLIATAVREPRGYWQDTINEAYSMFRFCWLAVVMCAGMFAFQIANMAYEILFLAGGGNRLGIFFTYAMAREMSVFCTGMAVAGVMGTAMCADLGARKIREELDALKVLGVDVIRMLVLPRVLAIVFITLLFNGLAIGLGTLMGLVAASVVGDTSPGAYLALLLNNITVPEFVGSFAKVGVIGFFIGLVCAQKGLNPGGGAEGVGRAVNQAVVACFAATWICSFLGVSLTLGLYPEILINR